MDGRVRGVAGFLLVLWCLAVSQAQIIPGTRQVRMETGSVRMSALRAYSPPTGGPAGTVEEEAPSHASGPEFSVPASIQSRQLATITTAAALSTAAATASFNTLSSPAPNLSFVAQTMSSNYPPDTNGAVGPNHLVTTTNDQIVVQDRSGHVLTNTALNTFWQSTWPDVNPAWDPNIRYDPYADRWIFACMANYGGVGSSLLVAVSATSDPTGTWYLRRVYADLTNTTTFDHPRLGFNSNWIVATGNELSDSTFAWLYSVVYAFDKADLYANGTKAPVEWSNITNAFTLSPALTYDPNLSTMYLLANYNGNSTSTTPALGYLSLSTITGAVGSEVLNLNVAYPSTTNVWASTIPAPPNLAPQLGATDKIGVFDARMNTVVYRNGSLWATHTVFVPAASPTLSAVDWWQIGTDGSVLQFGRIQDPTGKYFYNYPSLAVNLNSDMLIGYSRMASSEYASAAYAFRASADPAGTVRNEYVVQPGQGTYVLYDDNHANRWGDYSATQVDPLNDTDFWTVQEYAAPNTSGSQWGTWWANVIPPATSSVALQSISVNPSNVSGGQASSGTVKLSGAAPSGGAVVTLSSNNTAAQVPSSIAVAAGATSATFSITTTAVSASTPVTISASYNGVSQSTVLTVGGPAGYALAVSAQANRSGAIALNGARLAGNAYIFTSYASNLQNYNPTGISKVCYWLDNTSMSGTATHCESVSPYDFAGSVNNNPTSGANPWNTTTIGNGTHTLTQSVNLSNGTTEIDTATFTINNAYALQSVSVNPASINNGQTSTGTVTLSGAAPSGGALVRLSSNNAAAQVPASVTVAGGATSATFNITSSAVSTATVVTVSGTYNGVTQTASLTINPAVITYTISGTISGAGGNAATVNLTGISNATVTADASGNYAFTGLANGSYTVTPSKSGFNFTPASQSATVNGANLTAVNFSTVTYSISGSISGTGGSGATVSLTGASSTTVTADVSGNYTFAGLSNGSYTVTPSKSGFTFSPASQNVTVSNANIAGVNFSSASATTYSISGTISGAGGSGATVSLTGTSSASLTADASGNYTFTGLVNGSYSITPTKAGYSFTPNSQSVTVSGANVTGVNFSTAATFSISGTISGTGGSGATVTLGGAATATVTANSSGGYALSGLVNGSYTVTPSRAGYIFTPSSQTVTVAGANLASVNFSSTAQLAIDQTVSTDRNGKSSNITSPSFSTAAGNELLLAFVSTGAGSSGTMVTAVTGAGLTWSLVQRTNVQMGSAEIWRAFAPAALTNVSVSASLSQNASASITVLTFTGVDTSGTGGSGAIGAIGSGNANPGAPTASLSTTRSNSWVVGVGDDANSATARTLGSGQTMVHQFLAGSGKTFWVQRQTSTTPTSGTIITINDIAPASDSYNLSVCEILPAP